MAYTLDYHITQGILTKTTLDVRFRFGREVAPKDRESILGRINNDSKFEDISLDSYLKKNEGLEKEDSSNRYEREGSGSSQPISVKIKRKSFSLGFDLHAYSYGKMPLEKMINVEALNHFILTSQAPGISHSRNME